MISFYRNKISVLSLFFLMIVQPVFAENTTSAEFFVSNNISKTDMRAAYGRFVGKEQEGLRADFIVFLQKKHIEQGVFENILGSYFSLSMNAVIDNNAESFRLSPNQNFSDGDLFLLAKDLASFFHQESVAVFIPRPEKNGDVSVHFLSNTPGIWEVMRIVHDKLPAFYSEGFMLHLVNECCVSTPFDMAKVSQIEWLGSKINIDEVKKAFPSEKVTVQYGESFLVYQNGRKEKL